MRLLTIAAMVATTTLATTWRAEARYQANRYALPPVVIRVPTERMTFVDRLNGRMAEFQAGLDYVSGSRGSIQGIVTEEAAKAGVPVHLAHAIIRVESNYNCHARNPHSSASGAGQLIRATARAMGVRNVFDCRENIAGSMRYLRLALKRGGAGCKGVSLYESGIGARPRCSAYGKRVMRFAAL